MNDVYGFPLRSPPAMMLGEGQDKSAEEKRRQCDEDEKHYRKKWEKEWPAPLKGVVPKLSTDPGGGGSGGGGGGAFGGVAAWLRFRHLKSMCRQGVPAPFRRVVWYEASGAARIAREESAHVQYGLLSSDGAEHENQIELDLPRTFPDHPWYQSEGGQSALRRVLVAVSKYCKDTGGYCQSMNYIGAFLLLAMDKEEEKVFWVMVCVIREKVLSSTWSKHLSGCLIEMDTLGTLLRKREPRVAQHLEAIGCDVSYFSTDWFLCLYCKSLPSETVARIWDSFLLEGPKVLFRVALAIIKLSKKQVLACTNPGDVLTTLKGAQSALHDRCKLMDLAFNGLGSLPIQKIQKYRSRSKLEVDTTLSKRGSYGKED
ncbi:Rab-GTPase-TBC domain-containing protein [Chloropicon primus]|uniref:Rab-GTPase-TBC domain-containing protein n=1 Tax=Chloropicon primus TaxID=1764295 RepID=A0A5B8MVV9_9CHLO|nr:Rab-GTPase-TBC domain-containing protein [Chloropicon primus]UPR03700.1 Rab-GTPase-TBC domain-containing protein [Chloropicon primus]|eukprot:QDZ24491.1 Rab-GTPase-TBC domain-containing protein [Chloropicon primus]